MTNLLLLLGLSAAGILSLLYFYVQRALLNRELVEQTCQAIMRAEIYKYAANSLVCKIHPYLLPWEKAENSSRHQQALIRRIQGGLKTHVNATQRSIPTFKVVIAVDFTLSKGGFHVELPGQGQDDRVELPAQGEDDAILIEIKELRRQLLESERRRELSLVLWRFGILWILFGATIYLTDSVYLVELSK